MEFCIGILIGGLTGPRLSCIFFNILKHFCVTRYMVVDCQKFQCYFWSRVVVSRNARLIIMKWHELLKLYFIEHSFDGGRFNPLPLNKINEKLVILQYCRHYILERKELQYRFKWEEMCLCVLIMQKNYWTICWQCGTIS